MRFPDISVVTIIVSSLLLASSSLLSDAHRILLLPLLTKSHVLSITAIGHELVKRGHEVHMLVGNGFSLTPDIAGNWSCIRVIRYREQDNASSVVDYDALYENITRNSIEGEVSTVSLIYGVRHQMRAEVQRLFVGNDQLFDRLSALRFDMAVVDSVFFSRFLYLIPHRLGIPWITYTDIINPWLIRVPWLPSFYSHQMLGFCGAMTFMERLQNTVVSLLLFYFPLVPDPPDEVLSVYRKYGHFASVDDLIARSLLFVIASDVVLDEPLPYMPNMIHAGGLTVKPAGTKPLPKEFDEFITSAKSGAVIVSFGSMSAALPKSIAQKFNDVFSRLPDFHFVWRFENADCLPLPSNVLTSRWLPQNELLAHNATVAFVTHCGINGIYEAVYHAVPMLGFPLLGDQPHNARRIERKVYGIAMDIRDFTVDQLKANLLKIISDPAYKDRVRRASEIFQSARRTAAERVGDGIEHVFRFGAEHLRSPGSDIPLYQYLMLDILAFLAACLAAVLVLVWKVLRVVLMRYSIKVLIKRQRLKDD